MYALRRLFHFFAVVLATPAGVVVLARTLPDVLAMDVSAYDAGAGVWVRIGSVLFTLLAAAAVCLFFTLAIAVMPYNREILDARPQSGWFALCLPLARAPALSIALGALAAAGLDRVARWYPERAPLGIVVLAGAMAALAFYVVFYFSAKSRFMETMARRLAESGTFSDDDIDSPPTALPASDAMFAPRGDGALEWSVVNPPHLRLMAGPEGRRSLRQLFLLCLIALIAGMAYFAVAYDSPVVLLYAVPVAVGVFVAGAALVVLSASLMRLAGFGYSYHLDGEGMSFRWFSGRWPAAPLRTTKSQVPEGVDLGGFHGWASWDWLRDSDMNMEIVESVNAIMFREDRPPRLVEKSTPVIFLFCGGAERLRAVEAFVNARLED